MQTSIGMEISYLRSSPLFNLSLGSKELFHSNFLAWLFELYPRELGGALSRFLKDRSGDVAITNVLRELKNRDLTIHFGNGQELVIENKVKSLPYIEQLTLYSTDAQPHQNFVLLSLVPPPFSKDGRIDAGSATWTAITYADLASLLEGVRDDITDQYHASILADYIGFIRSMSAIFSSNAVKEDELFSEILSPYRNDTLSELHQIRIGDVYQKLRCEALAGILYKELGSEYPGRVHISAPVANRVADDIYVAHGMTNSIGLIEASCVIAPGLFLTIQVQGLSYRQMVQGYAGYGKDAKGVAERLRGQKLWFDFSNVGTGLKEYPRGEKPFNGYAGIDFYRSVTIPDDMTAKDVVRAIVADVRRIVTHRSEMSAAA